MTDTEEKRHRKEALDYHTAGARPGKVEIRPTKPTLSSRDLAKAYSPGVAYPCLEIAQKKEEVFKYTAKGNLVAVITNGSAVLGLGDIGPEASKPVMEGKGVLFKRFADIDVFDLELNETTVEGMVRVITSLEPTFGGINLEDIKAPECFEIEKQLVEKMNIPVFHDDQHGTAIIAAAGFLNALELTGRKIKETKIVFSGAGAASLACAHLFVELGVPKKNLIFCDSRGVIYTGRKEGMNPYKEKYANPTKARTLAEALQEADAFMGLSAKGILSQEMVKSMALKPIIFAMANPDPEILPSQVAQVRDDAIVATGRSDFPNQVNNVLGFPFIFRGALDVKAKKINSEMKIAAVKALAHLAKQEVPDEVRMAYGNEAFSFGPQYIIPKPFDSRVLTSVAPAVAKAAMDSGVARSHITDLKEYAAHLANSLGTSATFMKNLRDRLKAHVIRKKKKVRMVFAEGWNTRILSATQIIREEGRIEPILLGDPQKIYLKMDKLSLSSLKDLTIINPPESPHFKDFYLEFAKLRQRSGISTYHAEDKMVQENYFGSMMLRNGLADAFIAGPTLDYASCLVPIMNLVGVRNPKSRVAGIYILVFKGRVLFFADCTVQINPSEQHLAEIAANTAHLFRHIMGREPHVAFLSYSNFGAGSGEGPRKVKRAVGLAKERYPNMIIDGEMQADVAVNKQILHRLFSFSNLKGTTDILIFPELNSANIAYKLLSQLTEASAIGPILVPLNATVNIIQRTASIKEIVNMSNLTALLSEEEGRFYEDKGKKKYE